MKKIVELRAPVLTKSGYGVHSRQIAKYLLERDDIELYITPLPWGNTPWILDQEAYGGLIKSIMSRCTPYKNGPYDVSVQVQLPNEWNTENCRKSIGVTACVETDICNPEWVNCVNKMDLVVVPSEFSKKVFERTSNRFNVELNTTIKVIQESFIDEIFEAESEDIFEFDTDFNFLAIGQLTGTHPDLDRKNIMNTLKWFCEAFKDDESVGLILKTNSGRDTKIDRYNTERLISKIISEVRPGPFPKIHLLHGSLSNKEVAKLYQHSKVKAFLSLTRGEGYGLPLLEAAASGLPIIATNWSGHLEFLQHGKFVKIDFKLDDVPKNKIDNRIFMQGSKWANVDEVDIKNKLVKFKNKNSIPKNWARDLSVKIKEKFSFDVLREKYDKELGEFLC